MKEFLQEDKVKANITYLDLIKGIWPYVSRHRGLFALTVLSILFLAISSRLLPTIIGHAIDHGVVKKKLQVVYWSAIGFLLVEIIHAFGLFGYLYFFQRLGNRVMFYVREDLLSHVQKLPVTYFDKNPAGRIISRLASDTSTLGEVFSEGVINIFAEGFVLIAIVISMLLISVKLTVVTLLMSPLFACASIRLTDKIRIQMREVKKKLAELSAFMAENLSGMKVVQLYDQEKNVRSKFSNLSNGYADEVMMTIKFQSRLQPIFNLFNAVTLALALYYGGWLTQEGALGIGTMVAFLMHAQDIIPPFREILDRYQQFQNSLTSAERVFQLLEEKPEGVISSERGLRGEGEIQICHLNFQYDSGLPMVLKNIHLYFEPGRSYALVGRTGSGKTTLVSLVNGFYSAPEGSILIDGEPVNQIPLSILRKKIGIVQQDNFIFRGTIRDNISLKDKNISSSIVEMAALKVGYLDLLSRSGRSLDFRVEERGANLSAGERQLIAFARILAFQPKILILDEATANIDSRTEKIIQRATEEIAAGRTSIIIAHRLSTVQHCDQIIVMKQGEVIEEGNHKDLLKKKGIYYELIQEGIAQETASDELTAGTPVSDSQ